MDEPHAFPRDRPWLSGAKPRRGLFSRADPRGYNIVMATPTNSSGNLVDEFEESFQVERALYIALHIVHYYLYYSSQVTYNGVFCIYIFFFVQI